MDVESDPEETFTVADTEMKMKLKHLIALNLFIGDYRFATLQQKLKDCICQQPLCKKEMCSLLLWKTALEDGLLLMKEIRSALQLKGDIIFPHHISMDNVIASVFGNNNADH